jgi:hypothetical protein
MGIGGAMPTFGSAEVAVKAEEATLWSSTRGFAWLRPISRKDREARLTTTADVAARLSQGEVTFAAGL